LTLKQKVAHNDQTVIVLQLFWLGLGGVGIVVWVRGHRWLGHRWWVTDDGVGNVGFVLVRKKSFG
jgi:hypothetical protein